MVRNESLKELRKEKSRSKVKGTQTLEKLTVSEFRRLLNEGESSRLDFKQMTYNKRTKWKAPERSEFAKDIVSFANSQGGRIILGVVDKTLEVIGINTELFIPETMLQIASSYTSRTVQNLEIYPLVVDGKTVGVIDIPESSDKPHSFKDTSGNHEFYVRYGSINKKISGDEIQAMLRNR